MKRCLDFAASAFALLFLSPLFLLTALAVRVQDGGPVFYWQERLGRWGKLIRIPKFRSMSVRTDRVPGEEGRLGLEHPEITSCGRIIRRFKIDELPQLFSVLRGDMSIIGPRPCLPQDEKLFDDNGRKRLLVLPGCTGLAQTHGNTALDWVERWKYDAYYAQHLSFLLDLRILLKTLRIIVGGEDKYLMRFTDFMSKQGRNTASDKA